MQFRILGEITDVETFAAGSGIREIARLRRIYGRAAGASAKVLPACDYSMARYILLSYIGTRLPASDAGNSRSSNCSKTMVKTQTKQLLVCVDNEGYAASLEKRKIYVALRDASAERHGMLRVIDESGEDYLYPKALFRSIALPLAVRRAVLAA